MTVPNHSLARRASLSLSVVALVAAPFALATGGCAVQPGADDDVAEEAVGTAEGAATSALPAPADPGQRLYYGTPVGAYLTDEQPLSAWVFDARGGNEFKTSVAAYASDGSIDTTRGVGFKLYGLSRTWSGKLVWTLLRKADGAGSAVVTYTGAVPRTYMLTAASSDKPQPVQIGLSCKGTNENCELARQPGESCGGRTKKPQICDKGLFCQYATGSCGADDRQGTCVQPMKMCPALYKPVCGCNGKTYGNACAATSAGQSIAAGGACCTDPTAWSADPSFTLDGATFVSGEPVLDQFTYAFDADGNVQSTFDLCVHSICKVAIRMKKGTFRSEGAKATITYEDGTTATFEVQSTCAGKTRMVGKDWGSTITVLAK